MSVKRTFRLPTDLADDLARHARRRGVTQGLVVETAIQSILTPDADERIEAAFSRRMDKIARQIDKLDYHVEVTNEALALFVRFWLTANPPLPDAALAAAKAKGNERFEGFIEVLARQLEAGPRMAEGLRRDVEAGMD
jgi:predicted transcriptional regulator